jgi:hypothetical protein
MAGFGIVGVFVAMNVLVTSAPVVLSSTPTPARSLAPVFADTPSPVVEPTASPFDSPFPTAALPAKRPVIVNSAVSATDTNGLWQVYLAYPAFLAGTTPWAQQMNDEIYAEIQTRAESWQGGPASNPRDDGKRSTLDGSFSLELLTPALASFTLIWTDDSTPGSKALGCETINYDLATGQRIGYDTVFVDPQTAFVFMSGSALPQLSDKLGADYDASLAVPGTSPEPEHYRHWAIRQDGIKLTFSQNQVVLGDQPLPWVIVPWRAVRSVMNATGPVAKLAGI